ncbi:putative N-acetylmannosaminyltransferase [compost metagenome]
MGSPRQEEFISKYMDELPCKIFMGVGGSFDVFAGNVNRAPKWMISLGLEWLYRVSKEPWRIKRLGAIPKFLWLVLKNKIKRGNHE